MLYGFFNSKQFVCISKSLDFKHGKPAYPFCIYLKKNTGEYAIVTQVSEGEKYSANWDGPTLHYGEVSDYIVTQHGLNMGATISHDALRKALKVALETDKEGTATSLMYSYISKLVPGFKMT